MHMTLRGSSFHDRHPLRPRFAIRRMPRYPYFVWLPALWQRVEETLRNTFVEYIFEFMWAKQALQLLHSGGWRISSVCRCCHLEWPEEEEGAPDMTQNTVCARRVRGVCVCVWPNCLPAETNRVQLFRKLKARMWSQHSLNKIRKL